MAILILFIRKQLMHYAEFSEDLLMTPYVVYQARGKRFPEVKCCYGDSRQTFKGRILVTQHDSCQGPCLDSVYFLF